MSEATRDATAEPTLDDDERALERSVSVLVRILRYDDLTDDASDVGVVPTRPDRLVVGRDGRAGPGRLPLDDRRASSEHFAVERRGTDPLGPVVILQDLGSRNGTLVAGRRAERPVRLVDGDLVEVGQTLLVHRLLQPHEAPRVTQARPASGLGGAPTRSGAIAQLRADLERVAPTTEPVLVLGETGVGKELLAADLHAASGRRGELVTLDAGAIPETLFEAVLFGHKKGAFTGAVEHQQGALVRADGGTLFLDEIGNLPPAAQAKLLRALETGLVTPVGGTEARAIDVRWVAATNVDLFQHPGFRQDVVRRLAGWVARLPPLRQRREDLGLLTARCLREMGLSRVAIEPVAARALFAAAFPGNVRELRASLRSAARLAGGDRIALRHLSATSAGAGWATPDRGGPAAGARAQAEVPAPLPEPAAPDDVNAEAVRAALLASGGNVVQAARSLGTHARQLYRWIERWGIDLEELRRTPGP